MASKWNYRGDVNLEEGGYFWKHETGDDFVSVVDVVCDSNMGGADNVFVISVGSIYLNRDVKDIHSAMECCGYKKGPIGDIPVETLVDALNSYSGIDVSEMHWIRIGKPDPLSNPHTCEDIDITEIYGKNKLRNYVKKEFLR